MHPPIVEPLTQLQHPNHADCCFRTDFKQTSPTKHKQWPQMGQPLPSVERKEAHPAKPSFFFSLVKSVKLLIHGLAQQSLQVHKEDCCLVATCSSASAIIVSTANCPNSGQLSLGLVVAGHMGLVPLSLATTAPATPELLLSFNHFLFRFTTLWRSLFAFA